MIPKIVHVTWVRKDILENQSPLILNGIRNLIDMNPDWSVRLSEDAEVEAYLKAHLSASDYQLLRDRKIVEKTDVWRLLKIFNEGGLYIDLDRYYNIPLAEIIDESTKCVLPTYLDTDFSQDFMLSAPGNPIFSATLELNLQRRREGCDNIYFLGPQTYMHAITKVLLGQVLNSNPGADVFQQIRQELGRYPFIKTYREEPPNNTVVFRYDAATFKPGNGKGKEDLYREYGIRHWTGDF